MRTRCANCIALLMLPESVGQHLLTIGCDGRQSLMDLFTKDLARGKVRNSDQHAAIECDQDAYK